MAQEYVYGDTHKVEALAGLDGGSPPEGFTFCGVQAIRLLAHRKFTKSPSCEYDVTFLRQDIVGEHTNHMGTLYRAVFVKA